MADLKKMPDKALKKLQGDIDKELKSRERSKRSEAKKAAEAAAKKHGFSLRELFGARAAPKASGKSTPSPAKYCNPDDASQTWSGRGRQPAWYKAAITAGKDPKSMEI